MAWFFVRVNGRRLGASGSQHGEISIPRIRSVQAFQVERMRESYRQRRNFVVRRLNEMGLGCHSPGGAFYVFPDVRGCGLDSKGFAMRLLEEESVAAVPGTAFGPSGEGFLRCCYATAYEDLKTAMDRMEAFVGRLG